MKYLKALLVISIVSFFVFGLDLIYNINTNAEEKSELWNKNKYYCEGKEVNIEGCYKRSDQGTYSDLTRAKTGWAYDSMYNGSADPPPMDYLEIKNAKFMQAYTVLNNDEKVVLGACYHGYIKRYSDGKKNSCSSWEIWTNEIVGEKDAEHTTEVIILTVTTPENNNTCVSRKMQIITNGSFSIGHHSIPKQIDTPEYEGYKNGSCPQYFAYSSELKNIGLFLNPELEYVFTDNPSAKIKRTGLERFIDGFLDVDFDSRVGGCTQKDVEEEDKAKECYEKKLKSVTDYNCPPNIKDFNLELGNYEKECSDPSLYGHYAYSVDYGKELKEKYTTLIKNAYAEKIEVCTLENCNLTSSEITSVRNKMKNTICEFGCKIAVYQTQSDTKEGKCVACGGSQGVTYKWTSKDATPSGNCAEVDLSYDKCLGDSKTQECSECYEKAYAGLSDEKKACLLEILSEKAEKIQEYKDEVDEQFEDFIPELEETLVDVLTEIWDSSFSMFYIPGLEGGGFGQKGQNCNEVLKNNGVKIIKGVINILRIAGAIIAIANAMITLVPAIISKDADGLKKAGRKLVVMSVVLAIIGILPSIIYLIGVIFGYDLTCIF